MDSTFLFNIIISTLLGALIGFDREKNHKPAGLRTHMLVAIGASTFTLVSTMAFPNDPARIAANVVMGIGFLGAGTIFHLKNHVEGLTTAASLWATAAMAMAVALGFYIESAIVAVLIFLILELARFEKS